MTTPNTIVDRHQDILKRFQASGLNGLTDTMREEIAVLYVHERRKGAFTPTAHSRDDRLAEFFEHFRRQFAEHADPKVAIDYQRQLLNSARDLRSKAHPLEATILYATWAEHWVNGILIARALRAGLSPQLSAQVIRDTNWKAKLSWLWQLLDLPEIPEERRKELDTLVSLRNEYVHYKWRGRDPDEVTGNDPHLRAALDGVELSVAGLVDYGVSLDQEALGEAHCLFEEDLRARLRQVYAPPPEGTTPAWPPPIPTLRS